MNTKAGEARGNSETQKHIVLQEIWGNKKVKCTVKLEVINNTRDPETEKEEIHATDIHFRRNLDPSFSTDLRPGFGVGQPSARSRVCRTPSTRRPTAAWWCSTSGTGARYAAPSSGSGTSISSAACPGNRCFPACCSPIR